MRPFLRASTAAPAWPPRYYSYAAVLLFIALGRLFPAHAGLVLGLPLAVGMVALGVAHGACDQLVVPALVPTGNALRTWRYWGRFLGGYLGLAAVVGLLWWQWPAATVALFFLLTMWHWGSADAPGPTQVPVAQWLSHSLLRGMLLFAVPAIWWPTETAGIVNDLLRFTGARPVALPQFGAVAGVLGTVVAVGHGLLWLWYARHRRWALLQRELTELLVLGMLLLLLPPRWSVVVYFVFWHSLQHVLRLTGWLGYGSSALRSRQALLSQLWFFLRQAAPLLLLSCAALLVVGRLLASRLPDAPAWFSLALVVASIVTLPHALLVTLVMDAPQRMRAAARPAA
ncbi:Brp/Blh family beta-carotene 15,15'-dioxygenase [Hymenobacter yonginensis]|uniref:Probable beta-carotene 15,15'-dioxygenase n=1 Tax=Hymenobacter yonginensis TaxID=748197 RepID=A0ABY7PUX0_9BACT|nr:Brp/Blh family beta-carotene 15,15'-dioxygenase [Hymenobacter yonginensis]WBO86435.1 Brp/Blh family beta-carotene 15,15'-dioxygenase [Hymenobacter yonginensis]